MRQYDRINDKIVKNEKQGKRKLQKKLNKAQAKKFTVQSKTEKPSSYSLLKLRVRALQTTIFIRIKSQKLTGLEKALHIYILNQLFLGGGFPHKICWSNCALMKVPHTKGFILNTKFRTMVT